MSQENREKRSAKHQLRDRIPRIRFGLKTALALVTLLSAWLGYNAYVVRHRQELRRMIEERHLLLLEFGGKEAITGSTTGSGGVTAVGSLTVQVLGEPETAIPTLRRWMGDEAVASIVLVDNRDLEEIRAAFPEATVTVAPSFNPERIYDPVGMPVEPRREGERWTPPVLTPKEVP